MPTKPKSEGELTVQHHRQEQTYSKLLHPIWYRVAYTGHHIQIWLQQHGGIPDSFRLACIDGEIMVLHNGRPLAAIATYDDQRVAGSTGEAHDGRVHEYTKYVRDKRARDAYAERVRRLRAKRGGGENGSVAE